MAHVPRTITGRPSRALPCARVRCSAPVGGRAGGAGVLARPGLVSARNRVAGVSAGCARAPGCRARGKGAASGCGPPVPRTRARNARRLRRGRGHGRSRRGASRCRAARGPWSRSPRGAQPISSSISSSPWAARPFWVLRMMRRWRIFFSQRAICSACRRWATRSASSKASRSPASAASRRRM